MSRCATVTEIKGAKYGPLHEAPREGTRLREIYDLLQSNKGTPTDFTCRKRDTNRIDQLRDFYGLDIRNIGYRRWLLAGEWFGKVYIDYVAERVGAQ